MRTRRFFGGVSLGYLHLSVVTLVGLWLTPFFLVRLGQQEYGLWLVCSQLLAYMALLDLGVVALLPRETAYATGRGGAAGAADLRRTVAVVRRAVRWQMPLVAVAALGIWVVVSGESPSLAVPFAIILGTFVFLFPARLYQAVLQGLQELPFLGRVQLVTWGVATAVTVALVLAGAGLYALAAGWAFGQVLTVAWTRARVVRRHPEVLPAAGEVAPTDSLGRYARQAGWISVAQVAQVLLSGSDLLVVGKLLGAAAVVPYACTAKLVTVLANHPQLLMQAATPALSEMRSAGDRARLAEATAALTLAMLVVGGGVASVVLAVNRAFVEWWVGPAQYTGTLVTILLVVTMLVRHWNVTAIYGMFCFGHERLISIRNLVDGVLTVAAIAALVPAIGFAGVPLGSLLAVLVASLPWNLLTVARSLDLPVRALVGPLWPWLWRFLLFAPASAAMAVVWSPQTFVQLAVASAGVAGLYAAVMAWGLANTPLGRYVRPRLAALWPGHQPVGAAPAHPPL